MNQIFQVVKDCLSNIIKPHFQSKAIICSNSASCLQELLQTLLDDWLDTVEDFKGDTVSVIRYQETKLKLAYTVTFTMELSDHDRQDDNVFYPQFMLGMPGCIGADLDYDDIHLVCRIGLWTSILHIIQEMGRCGRKSNDRGKEQACVQDIMTIIFTLSDFFVYLNEHLFVVFVFPCKTCSQVTR